MAGELCSPTSYETYNGTNGCSDPLDLTTQFTVPSDCDCLVVCLSSYFGISTNPITGIDWDDDGTPQAMTLGGRQDDTSGNQAIIYYLLDPTTGQNTLNIDFAASGTPQERIEVTCVYLKNIDSSGTVVGTDGQSDADPNQTSIVGTNNQDIAIGCAYDYSSSQFAWDAGTSLFTQAAAGTSPCATDQNASGAAYDDTGSPFTIDQNPVGASASSLVAVLFKGTTAGGSSIPVLGFNHYQRNIG